MSMLHEITTTAGGHQKPKRKGRGRSAGQGKTAGRGTKGMKARVGAGVRTGYEGGQTEIFRRFPKRGFSNVQFECKYQVINVSDLERFDDGHTVDPVMLVDAGLCRRGPLPVKVLGNGTLTKRLIVTAAAFSGSAVRKILAAGGATQDLLGRAIAAEDSGAAAGGEDESGRESGAPHATDGSDAQTSDQPESGTMPRGTIRRPASGGASDDVADQPESGTR